MRDRRRQRYRLTYRFSSAGNLRGRAPSKTSSFWVPVLDRSCSCSFRRRSRCGYHRRVARVLKGTVLHKRRTLYLQFVASGLPLLPHVPLFHKLDALNASLRHFEIHVLDVVDVVVSKLRPFRSSDQGNIQAMVERGLVPHDRLVARFRDAVDEYVRRRRGGRLDVQTADRALLTINHVAHRQVDLLGRTEHVEDVVSAFFAMTRPSRVVYWPAIAVHRR